MKERERLFAIGAERFPQLAEYAWKTDRVIPVIVLTPRGGARALFTGRREMTRTTHPSRETQP